MLIPRYYDFKERKCLNCWNFGIFQYDDSSLNLINKLKESVFHISPLKTCFLGCELIDGKLRREFNCFPYNYKNDCKFFEARQELGIMDLVEKIVNYDLKDGDEMTFATDENGEKIIYNYLKNKWEYPDEPEYENVDGKKKRTCRRCNKPCIDINGVNDVDFCMQGLTQSDFITAACCGHGDYTMAYIALADGRRFVLDKEWSRKP